MKKQIVLALASVLFLFSLKSHAQDKTAYDKGTTVATIGFGFPDLYRTNLISAYNKYNSSKVSSVGPIILKGDYGIVKFKWGHTVGVGIVLGYNSTSIKYTDTYHDNKGKINTYTETHNYSTMTVGARGAYHFFTKEKIDCYASIGLGLNFNKISRTGFNPSQGYPFYQNQRSVLYSAFTVGIRYYFTKNFGVYSELGWDNSTPIQAGFALKF